MTPRIAADVQAHDHKTQSKGWVRAIMADKNAKYTDNVPGPFYVDNTCIDCDACRVAAPDNFERSDEGGYSYVAKQPENDEEYQMCLDAMEGCPVEAIGEDGDE